MSPKRENLWRAVGILIPIVISFIAMGVLWGGMTNQMENFSKRLDGQDQSIEKLSDILTDVRNDVSFIKGKLQD